MAVERDLTEQEEKIIGKAVDEFEKYGKTNITCPICNGKLAYDGNRYYSSFTILCENCGDIYSLRGL